MFRAMLFDLIDKASRIVINTKDASVVANYVDGMTMKLLCVPDLGSWSAFNQEVIVYDDGSAWAKGGAMGQAPLHVRFSVGDRPITQEDLQ